ncbi:uncharacterized protein LOC141915462 isoform X2 [Tubulanus polymorphus]|uniref:uncharacterized protein LOC141915462 isoform X2 n=1 Tax=Tubulanus polymorphus TaxID=672921 RepID=UPI003DA297BF
MSSISTISEVPGINNAVQHLLELGERMKLDLIGFNSRDVSNIDIVIEAIQELEIERSQSHHKLETETIKASIHRHKLKFFPEEIEREIAIAVNVARASNEAQLKRLQEQLDEINKSTSTLENKLEELEKENAILHPERDRVRSEHEEIIAELNHRLADKASKQIMLNETRDKLRETNEKIIELEEGIVTLKEDLIQERLEHRHEKKRLKDLIAETDKKSKEQKQENRKKDLELSGLMKKKKDTEDCITILNQNIQRHEMSKANMEAQEIALTDELNRKITMNNALRQKGLDIVKKTENEQKEHEERVKRMFQHLNKLVGDTEDEREKGENLEEEKDRFQKEYEGVLEIRKKDQALVNELNENLQRAKDDLAKKAEDCGELQKESFDMDERISEMAETHKAVVASLNKQIDESREQLAKERKDRMDLQGDREGVQKEVDAFRQEYQKYMRRMNKKINEAKTEHENLSKESQQLQKDIKSGEKRTKTLTKELAKANEDFTTMQHTLDEKIAHLENDIASMEKSLREKQDKYAILQPEFEQLQKDHDEKVVFYDNMKKEVAALKNKKNSLDDATKKVQRDIEKQARPYAEFTAELKKKQLEAREQIKQHAIECTEIEKKIYSQGCKLKTVMEENDRFSVACTNLDNKILDINQQIDDNITAKERLRKELLDHRDGLMCNWLEDISMEEKFAERDSKLLEDMANLLKKTGHREQQIGEISDKLKSELDMLASFLNNVTQKRPKELQDDLKVADAIEVVADANVQSTPRTARTSTKATLQPESTSLTQRTVHSTSHTGGGGLSVETTKLSELRTHTKQSQSTTVSHSPRKK